MRVEPCDNSKNVSFFTQEVRDEIIKERSEQIYELECRNEEQEQELKTERESKSRAPPPAVVQQTTQEQPSQQEEQQQKNPPQTHGAKQVKAKMEFQTLRKNSQLKKRQQRNLQKTLV
jgi:biotin carboxyl carrier protein